MSLLPGSCTFSVERVHKIWREGQHFKGRRHFNEFEIFSYDSDHNLQYPKRARKFCLNLYKSAQNPKSHVAELDKSYDPIFLRPFMKSSLSDDLIVDRACRLLSQLPAAAPDILDALPFNANDLPEYCFQLAELNDPENVGQNVVWSRLKVVKYVSDNTIRLALHAARYDLTFPGPGVSVKAALDATMELLKLSLAISSEECMRSTTWLVVCAFLWTSWQRNSMLYLWMRLRFRLDGALYDENRDLCLEGIRSVPVLYRLISRVLSDELRQTPFLCGWALRSLRNDRANVTMDLRYFHKKYHVALGDRLPICNPGPVQCDGSSSHACKRFKNTVVKNQSMNDHQCNGSCQRLFWSRESFLSVSGPRAIDTGATDSTALRYCQVTERTLTVSHVWSHGQGGRPDKLSAEGTGFNSCLHRRYTEVARALDCDSYWMDTPCIPSEKDLRWECISQITSIFSKSAKTVICDRDLMSVKISDTLTMHDYELLLAILLVCDWSVRASTLLEAMRARRGLYILCRENRLVSVAELLETVHARGRIDLVVLSMTRAYLLKPADGEFELFEDSHLRICDRETEDGFVSIGEAAVLLGHRHATRDGDDLLIWSLLIGDMENENPVDMWKRQIGGSITTGSLISSATRIKGIPGLGWAPITPSASRPTSEDNDNTNNSATMTIAPKTYPAYDGSETAKGLITVEGLRARWLVHEFPISRAGSDAQYGAIIAEYLSGHEWGALLLAMPNQGPRNIPVMYRETDGYVMVVCGSNAHRDSWEWKGLFEWERNQPLPKLAIKEILIV